MSTGILRGVGFVVNAGIAFPVQSGAPESGDWDATIGDGDGNSQRGVYAGVNRADAEMVVGPAPETVQGPSRSLIGG